MSLKGDRLGCCSLAIVASVLVSVALLLCLCRSVAAHSPLSLAELLLPERAPARAKIWVTVAARDFSAVQQAHTRREHAFARALACASLAQQQQACCLCRARSHSASSSRTEHEHGEHQQWFIIALLHERRELQAVPAPPHQVPQGAERTRAARDGRLDGRDHVDRGRVRPQSPPALQDHGQAARRGRDGAQEESQAFQRLVHVRSLLLPASPLSRKLTTRCTQLPPCVP